MRFSRQEHWSGLPFPSPGDIPNQGIELVSIWLPGRFFTTEPLGKPYANNYIILIFSHSYVFSQIEKVLAGIMGTKHDPSIASQIIMRGWTVVLEVIDVAI